MSHYGCHSCKQALVCICDKEPVGPMWTLLQGLDMVRGLQPGLVKVNWNVALGGGVLYKGESLKDLDLVFFPYDTSKARIYRLQDRLEDQGWTRTNTVNQMWAHWRETGVTDRKHIEVYRTPSGKRIDAIILGGLE